MHLKLLLRIARRNLCLAMLVRWSSTCDEPAFDFKSGRIV
jgi:hypothetical protein